VYRLLDAGVMKNVGLCHGLRLGDLVFSANGYVDFAAQLYEISTDLRDFVAVKIRPGYL
jgi:hypothetical protein